VSPEIIALSDAHALAVWRIVVVQIWERELDPAAAQRKLERTLAIFKRERRASPGGLVLAFSLISANATMPDPTSRAIAAEFPSYFDYYVGVHEGAEPRGSLVCTAIGAMALAARVEPRYELVDDLVEGCRRLAARSQGGVQKDELGEVIRTLRAQIATAGAA